MRIAVTFENGEVGHHFGKAAQIKVYEVVDGEVINTEIVEVIGEGHGAIVGLLNDYAIDTVLCGGMGEHAMEALGKAGIAPCTGVSGDADQAVAAYLNGEFTSEGVNCNCHEEEPAEEESGCGGGCGGCSGCGGGCSGCGGGCGGFMPTIEGKNVGKKVQVHYTGTFNDGSKFDSSYDRGQTLDFICGFGMMIEGFDKAVANMEVGEKVNVHLMPAEAYGEIDPDLEMKFEIAALKGSEDLSIGDQVYLRDDYGRPTLVRVVEKDDTNIVLDANSEMAGKELNFEIELVEVE